MALCGMDPEMLAALKLKAKGKSPSTAAMRPLGMGTNNGSIAFDESRNWKLPPAQSEADTQLSRCTTLAEAIKFTAKTLAQAGLLLQHGAVAFTPVEGEDAPLAGACHGLCGSCGELGLSLGHLANKLSGEILAPLEEVRKAIDSDWKIRKAELAALESRETLLEKRGKGKSLTDVARGLLGFKKQNSDGQQLNRPSTELEHARMRKQECNEEIQKMIVLADTALKAVLQPVLLNCAEAWKQTADDCADIARKCKADASSLTTDSKPGDAIAMYNLSRIGEATQAPSEPPAQASAERAHASSSPSTGVQGSMATGPAPVYADSTPTKASAVIQAPADTRGNPFDAAEQQTQAAALGGQVGGFDESESEAADDVSSVEEDEEGAGVDLAGHIECETMSLEFVAGVSEGPLGLKLSWPPGPVTVQMVVPGSWGELCGLVKGAEIVSVNGEVCESMQEAELKQLMKQRPLTLAAVMPEGGESQAQASEPGAATVGKASNDRL